MNELVDAFIVYVCSYWHEDIAESISKEGDSGVIFDIPESVVDLEEDLNKWYKEADAFCHGWGAAKGKGFRAHYSWGFGDNYVRMSFEEV
jgi:hypothetical protein